MEKSGLVAVERKAGSPPSGRPSPRPAPSAAVQLGLAFPEALREAGVLAAGREGHRRRAIRRLVSLRLGRPAAGGLPDPGATGRRRRRPRPFSIPGGRPRPKPSSPRFKADYGRQAVVFHGRMTREAEGGGLARPRERPRRSRRRDALGALSRDGAAPPRSPSTTSRKNRTSRPRAPPMTPGGAPWLRARSEGAVAVFGSSRPTVEAFAEARRLRDPRSSSGTEPRRAGVTIVDHSGDAPIVSRELEQQAPGRLEKGEPAILFLNRRGYAAQIVCSGCGRRPALSALRHRPRLSQGREPPDLPLLQLSPWTSAALAPAAAARIVVRRGAGTQAVEEELGRLFPKVRVARFDADTASKPEERRAHPGRLRQGPDRRSSSGPSSSSISRACRRPGSWPSSGPSISSASPTTAPGRGPSKPCRPCSISAATSAGRRGCDPDGGAGPLLHSGGRGGRLSRRFTTRRSNSAVS